MEPRSVLVSYPSSANAGERYGSSGILISEHWVLTHGSLLKPAIAVAPRVLDLVTGLRAGEMSDVTGEVRSRLTLRVARTRSRQRAPWTDESGRDNAVVSSRGFVVAIWKCPLVRDTLDAVFQAWRFDKHTESNRLLLPVFALIKLEGHLRNEGEASTPREALQRFARLLGKPGRGLVLDLESTPFGNPVFIDSVARGVVSNVIGSGDSIVLTDANAVPGCEGGPVYVTYESGRRVLCGMVIAPLSWCRGEWVEFTFVANLLPCLKSVLGEATARVEEGPDEDADVEEEDSRLAGLLDRSMLVIKCGSQWGSGILLDRGTGTILTCSHVVSEALKSRVRVLQPGSGASTSIWAKLVYRTTDGKPYDVAVLRVDPRDVDPSLRSISIGNGPVLRGEPAVSAGFPFFSSSRPTITRGNVSQSLACMLQTTCCVQSGSSGGPVVRWPTGELLGMVVCNAISSVTTALYPRLNMAVPASVLKGPLDEYLESGDPRALDALESDDTMVRQMWNLYLLPPSKI